LLKLGIYGGTFNPVHKGHILFAEEALTALNLDAIVFMPVASPPHKDGNELAPPGVRANMIRIAVKDRPYFQVSEYEIKKGGKSYTADTLEYLKSTIPMCRLYLLMGSDMFLTLTQWREYETILADAVICASARNEEDKARIVPQAKRLADMGADCEIIMFNPIEISSSQIRKSVAERNYDIETLDGDVLNYIRTNKLYA
jgi:nicotinate-nucleotide adenylyltransferase